MTIAREQERLVSHRPHLTKTVADVAGTAPATIPAVADTELDAELLRLDREHDVAFARSLSTGVGPDGLDDDDCEEICEALNDLELAIRSIPAQTLAGVAVKARIAAEYVVPADPKQPILDDIVNSLIEDVLRIAKVSAKRATTWHAEEG
jgi:hypothetical protein